VDDPYTFGQIAATNSLADVYVCGAKPLLALNLICFPEKDLPVEILKDILRGGADKVKEAGALLVGGHSVDDKEPKYGLAVVGIVHPDKVITNSQAKAGEILYLSKPIGTGILATAYKGGLITPQSEAYKNMVEVMTELNDKVLELMQEFGVKSATDITGFGLLGHALEMAIASKKVLRIYYHQIPIIKEALEFVKMGIIPEGDYKNLNYCKKFVKISPELTEEEIIMACDSQTSGGILFSVSPEKAQELEVKAIEKGLFFLKAVGEVLEPKDTCPTVELYP